MNVQTICKILCWNLLKLEQLERLRSEDTPRPHDYPYYWPPHIGSQVRTRSKDLEDIGQGQRSSHATYLLMLVIICTKYGKNPSTTVDATERTRFSRPRPNDLKDICQGQRTLHATHPLILVIGSARHTACHVAPLQSLRLQCSFMEL